MTPVPINFDAAATLYKKKVSLRKRSDLKPGLIELPEISWRMDRQHQPSLSNEDMVRTWMRYLTLAIRRSFAGSTGTVSFVALIKAGTENDSFAFQMCCPYRELLEPLRNSPPTRALVEEPDDGVSVRYKFWLPQTLSPVAFVFDRDAKTLLVTNENHMSAPAQFLDIERVKMTSGFLNFVGTIMVLNYAKSDETYATKMPQLHKDAMAARQDEWLRWLYLYLDSREIFKSTRILIDQNDPERYYFIYPTPETENT